MKYQTCLMTQKDLDFAKQNRERISKEIKKDQVKDYLICNRWDAYLEKTSNKLLYKKKVGLKISKNNSSLAKAQKIKNDEFYTRIIDIAKELPFYKAEFKDKIILIPCEVNFSSNFGHYFLNNIINFKYKKIIIVGYNKNGIGIVTEYTNNHGVYENTLKKYKLKGDGDFRSQEVIELYKEADIIVTNPPFSLFREFINQLMNLQKKFLIIGCKNALTCKEIFQLFQDNKIWLGYNDVKEFNISQDISFPSTKKFGNIGWFTNLDVNSSKKLLNSTQIYEVKKYKKYLNYDAINIDRIKDIPKDYFEPMGVPITFLEYYNSNEFKIIQFRKGNDKKYLKIQGKSLYCRIIIQRLK